LTICIQQGVFPALAIAADSTSGTTGSGSNLPSEHDLDLILGNPQPKSDPQAEELQPATKTSPAGSDVYPPGAKPLPESSDSGPPGAKQMPESSDVGPPGAKSQSESFDVATPAKSKPESSDETPPSAKSQPETSETSEPAREPEISEPPPTKKKATKSKAKPKQVEESPVDATTGGESGSDSTATADDAPLSKAKSSKTSKGKKKDSEDWGYNETSKGKKPADDGDSGADESGSGESTAAEETPAPPTKAKEDTGKPKEETSTGSDTGSDSLFSTPFVKKKSSDTEDDGSEEDLTIMKSRKSTKRVGHIAEADELLLKHKYQQAEDAYRSLIAGDQTGDAYAGLAVALARQNNSKKSSKRKNSFERQERVHRQSQYGGSRWICFVHALEIGGITG
jgi:hypothetical protein